MPLSHRSNRAVFLRTLLPLVAGASVLVFAGGCKPSGDSGGGTGGGGTVTSGDTIKVGHFAAMTGDQATEGTDANEGILLALDEINAAGGVGGKKISVDTQDDQSKPDEAKTVATKFAADDKMVAVLGEVSSSRSLAAAPVFDKAGIPMLSPASTNEAVTQKGPHIFRICYIDPFQGYVVAKFATETLKAKKIAIFRDKKSDYSNGLADAFTKSFTSMGGTIALDTSYTGGDSDFNSQLAQIKAANPDGVFIPGYYGDIGPIARQAKDLKLTVPILGADGWDSSELVKGAGGPGGALEGAYFANHYSKDDKAPVVQNFVKAYQAKYNKIPSCNAALGYDAMKILADAIKRAGSPDREAITKALAATKDYPGVTGVVSIDENRNARKSAVMLQIKGDDFVYKATIDPPGAAPSKPAVAASPAASPKPAASPAATK